VEHGFVRKAGAWYTYEGDQLGQGKENARNFLKDNPDLANEIEKKIKEKLGVGVRPAEPAATEPGPDAAAADPAPAVPAPATAKAAKSKAAAAKS
jgi:recombination protein RecA